MPELPNANEKTIEIRVPRSLRDFSGDPSPIQVQPGTVGTILEQIESERPKLYQAICDERGKIRRHLHLFVNSERIDLSEPAGYDAQLSRDDILTVWTAVSGG
jgi:sulfur-carrier protein